MENEIIFRGKTASQWADSAADEIQLIHDKYWEILKQAPTSFSDEYLRILDKNV